MRARYLAGLSKRLVRMFQSLFKNFPHLRRGQSQKIAEWPLMYIFALEKLQPQLVAIKLFYLNHANASLGLVAFSQL